MSIGHYNDSVDRPIDPLDRLLRRRVVMLSGAVTGEMAQDVMARLLYLEAEDPEAPVEVRINSPGGDVMAGLAILSKTELLLVVLGGLFVVETLSVMLQVATFKARKKRLFKMAPIHHHFELLGWAETTVIIRFWIIAGLAVAFGLGLFYAESISYGLP